MDTHAVPIPDPIPSTAPCLLWEARVTGEGDLLRWHDVRFLNQEAAEQWLPIARAPGESYGTAWRRARHPADEEPSHRLAVAEIRAGRSFWRFA